MTWLSFRMQTVARRRRILRKLNTRIQHGRNWLAALEMWFTGSYALVCSPVWWLHDLLDVTNRCRMPTSLTNSANSAFHPPGVNKWEVSCCNQMAAITIVSGGAVWWTLTRWRQVWCVCSVKTVWSIPERFRSELLTTGRYTNLCTFTFTFTCIRPITGTYVNEIAKTGDVNTPVQRLSMGSLWGSRPNME